MTELIKSILLALVVIHATEVFLQETRNNWPRGAAWQAPALRAKVKLLLSLMAWTFIKSAPIVYYSMDLYDHVRVVV